MSELVINKRVLKVKVDGVDYQMKYPTVEQALEFDAETKGKDSSEIIKCGIKFIERLGLPCEVLKELELEHITSILEKINERVKKN